MVLSLIALTMSGCAIVNPYSGIKMGDQSIGVGVANGETIPSKVASVNIKKLPLKMTVSYLKPAERKLYSKYFHTRGDWPTLSYMVMALPKSSISNTGGWQTQKLSYDVEAEAKIMDWENPAEALMYIPANMKMDAYNKGHVKNAMQMDTAGFMERAGATFKHNHLMMTVQKLDKIRGKLNKYAEKYQTYKAMN
jgi:hypothetical protein